MDMSAVLSTIEKGLSIISALTVSGKEIEPALKVLFDLVTNAKTGDVTDDQLAKAEASLDAIIDDFNTPME